MAGRAFRIKTTACSGERQVQEQQNDFYERANGIKGREEREERELPFIIKQSSSLLTGTATGSIISG